MSWWPGEQRFKADYLVACATPQGAGTGVQPGAGQPAFGDLYREGAPVTFLAPAIPERYRKAGFEYVSSAGSRLRRRRR